MYSYINLCCTCVLVIYILYNSGTIMIGINTEVPTGGHDKISLKFFGEVDKKVWKSTKNYMKNCARI